MSHMNNQGIIEKSQTQFLFNFTNNFDEPEDVFQRYDSNSRTWIKTGFIITGLVSQIIAIPSIGIMLVYEKFGGDPKKRSILNKLVSSALYIILSLIVPLNVFLIRLITGPFPEILAKLLFFIPKVISGFAGSFVLIELMIIRYLSMFYWKSVPPINEDFFALFLNVSKILISVLLTLYGNMGYNVEQNLNLVMSGVYHHNTDQTPIFRFYSLVLVCNVLIYLTAGSRLSWKKMKSKEQVQKKIRPIILTLQTHLSRGNTPLPMARVDIEAGPISNNNRIQPQECRFNTTAHNKDILNLFVKSFAVLAMACLFILQWYVYKDVENPIALCTGWFSLHVFIIVAIPCGLIYETKDILPFIKRELL